MNWYEHAFHIGAAMLSIYAFNFNVRWWKSRHERRRKKMRWWLRKVDGEWRPTTDMNHMGYWVRNGGSIKFASREEIEQEESSNGPRKNG